ncbi:MAG: endonuclease/exonuclease/phosphatase family protein [Alistipes sp.]|nr:endonuclease/exonuclease/phosphatase family protein [Alistipes sp.]
MKRLLPFITFIAIVSVCCGSIETPNDNENDKQEQTPSTPTPEIFADLESITYTPLESGAAAVVRNAGDDSSVILDLTVVPKEYVATLAKKWRSTLSCKAFYGSSDNNPVSMQLVGFRSNTKNGTISITAMANQLSEEFFAGTQSAYAQVSVTDDDKTVTSNNISLKAGEPEIPADYGGLQKYAKTTEMKIMSFNVRLDTSETDATNNWSNRKKACIELIKDHRPDIIGFQEAKYTSQWLYFKEQLKSDYDGWGLNRDTGTESGSGEVMGILYNKSRIEKIKGGTFWLSETPDKCSIGWDAACKRTATWGLFRHTASNRLFLYINTHLDHKGSEAQTKGLALVAEYFKQYPSYTHILTGDMNIVSSHSAFNAITSSMMNTRENAPKGRTDNNTTYNGYTSGKHSVIDHIYCSKNMTIVEYHTINESYGVPYISDHYPIYAIVKMQ